MSTMGDMEIMLADATRTAFGPEDPNPTPNIPLLRKAVEWVEEQAALPEEKRLWDQRVWCGTTMCVAGYVATTNGWERQDYDGLVAKDGQRLPASTVARRLMGLSHYQDHALFIDTIVEKGDTGTLDVQATAAAVRQVCERIAGERL